jgi:iron complex transport system substrate-binding protein
MMVAGRDTIAAQLIEMAGGVNAAGDLVGFKPLNAEMVSAAAPDVVLTVEERWKDMGGAAGMKRLPGMAGTPAARQDRMAALPGPLMLGLGPRIGEAVQRLARLIHGTE